jgi:hypothetical protein
LHKEDRKTKNKFNFVLSIIIPINMKFYFLKFICLFCVVVALSACLNDDETTVTSSTNPRMTAFTLAGNDSIKTAVFTLNADSVTVENLDSLPFGTPVTKGIPTFTFVSSYGAMYYLNGSTTGKYITGKDTIDFSLPVRVINKAADNITSSKEYIIKVNVHKVEPKLYVWNQLSTSAGAANPTSQKAIYFNNKLLYYANEAGVVNLYTSTNGTTWAAATLSGLPANASMVNTVQLNGKLFYTQDGVKIYSSTDGASWTSADISATDYTFKTMLFTLNGSIWAITQSKEDLKKYRFASSVDGTVWLIRNELPASFPLTDFAALSFTSRVGSRPRAIIIGGKDKDNNVLKTNWNTEDGDYWVNFNENVSHSKSLDTLALGASLIAYDSKLFVFGTKIDSITVPQYKVSLDEGLTWKAPDTLYNRLPKTYTQRNYSSVVVDSSNRIYIVGGKANATILTDVWTGKLNRLGFIIK